VASLNARRENACPQISQMIADREGNEPRMNTNGHEWGGAYRLVVPGRGMEGRNHRWTRINTDGGGDLEGPAGSCQMDGEG